MKISIIIPAYNEEKYIEKCINEIIEYTNKSENEFEIIVANNCSKDMTAKIVKNLMQTHNVLKLVDASEYKGKGYAVKAGMLYSTGDYRLFTDTDLSTPITELDKFIKYIKKYPEHDIFIGNRQHQNSDVRVRQNVIRQTSGKIFNILVRILGLSKIKDTQCGFKLFSKTAADKIFKLNRINGFAFDVEILMLAKKLNLKIIDVPVIWINRFDTRVNFLSDSLKMFIELIKIKLLYLFNIYCVDVL